MSLKPIHPGEILREEFLVPLKLTPNALAIALRVPAPSIYDIVHEKRAITTLMALRLGRYFGNTPEFWINLQSNFELRVARQKEQKKIEREVQPLEAIA